MHVIDRCPVGLKLAGFSQRPAAAAHQEAHGASVQPFDGFGANVLCAAPVPEVEEKITGFQRGLEFGFGRLALDD